MARKVAAAALVAVSAAGVAFWRRSAGRSAEHVDVYGADGSMISFAPGSAAADRLLPLARRILAAARG